MQDLKRNTLSRATKLQVNFGMIRVQEMRRKFGACSSSGTLTLASDVADQDARLQDYVIAHELLHLRLDTQGIFFKALMSAHVPGWQAMDAQRRAVQR